MKRITEPDNLQLEAGRLIPSLILASSSPNRKALLEKGGIHVDTFAPEADESRIGDTPDEKVEGIARRKIMAYISSPAYDENRLAIAADTLVLFGNAEYVAPHLGDFIRLVRNLDLQELGRDYRQRLRVVDAVERGKLVAYGVRGPVLRNAAAYQAVERESRSQHYVLARGNVVRIL